MVAFLPYVSSMRIIQGILPKWKPKTDAPLCPLPTAFPSGLFGSGFLSYFHGRTALGEFFTEKAAVLD
jgi:hypothetical protein